MSMFLIAILSLLVFLVVGVPVSFGILLSGSVAAIITGGMEFTLIGRNLVSGMDSFPLMACPFFILAGELMSSGGISKRIISFARSLVGYVDGGTALTTVAGSMIFAAISGSAAATTAAMGSITVPAMNKEGYKRGFTASLIACSGSLGPIIPPSISMIVYCSVTGDSIGKMFMGGVLPGVIAGLGLMTYAFFYARKDGIPRMNWPGIKFFFANIGKEFVRAIWALLAPVIIIGGILGGIFTATEAGIVACWYSIFCGFFIYRELDIKSLKKAMSNCISTSGMIMMIMGAAEIYSYIFAVEQVGVGMQNALLSITHNPTIMLFIIFLIMMVMGCFMEMLAVLVVLAPTLTPLLLDLGLDPIHFGVILCIASCYGALTPPVGIQIFVAQGIVKVRMKDMFPYLYPMIGIMAAMVILCILVPDVVTCVPNLFY